MCEELHVVGQAAHPYVQIFLSLHGYVADLDEIKRT